MQKLTPRRKDLSDAARKSLRKFGGDITIERLVDFIDKLEERIDALEKAQKGENIK